MEVNTRWVHVYRGTTATLLETMRGEDGAFDKVLINVDGEGYVVISKDYFKVSFRPIDNEDDNVIT